MSLTVVGANVSPFVRKVRVFLAEKGVEYDLEPVNPFAPPDGFRELSPLGKIPVLRDGDRTLPDSSVICAYLERKFEAPRLYPVDAFTCARALWIQEFVGGGMIPTVGPKIFFPLVLQPLMTGKEPDADTLAGARRCLDDEVPALWDYLEGELGDREFFAGDELSIADLTAASPFVNLRHAGVAPDPARWPHLAGFVERMHARPSFAAILAEETPIFGRRAGLLER